MSSFDKRAQSLQNSIHSDEAQKNNFQEPDHIREMIYHTRLDVVLLYSHLSDLNKQVRFIKWTLVFIATCILLIGSQL